MSYHYYTTREAADLAGRAFLRAGYRVCTIELRADCFEVRTWKY